MATGSSSHSIPEALASTELRLLLGQRGLHPGGHQHGRRGGSWAGVSQEDRRCAPLTGTALAAPSWWCSAMRWRITPLWPARSTAWARRRRVINVGVSGPGVVHHALQAVKGQPFDVVAETIKKTAFRVTRMGQLVAQEASQPAGRALWHRGPVPGAHPRHRRLAWPASWRKWAWSAAAPTAPPQPWRC